MDTSNLVLVASAGGVGRSVLEHLRAQDMPVRGMVHPTFRSLSHRVCRVSRNTVPVGRSPAHARVPEQPNRVGVVRVGLEHDHAYVFKTLEEPAQRRVIGRLFELVRDSLVGGGALLAHPVPPIATGQASTTRGASNKKACQVLHWSPIYPSWREGFVQAAQEWGKQKGTSETEKA